MAEMLSDAGYSTGMFGKWHLGRTEGRFPTDQGFDEWYGVPNSTDESAYTALEGFAESGVEESFVMEARKGQKPKKIRPYRLGYRPLIDGDLTEKSIDFMKRQSKDGKPFFLYIPYTATHYPTRPHPDFAGKTGNGDWADVMAEFDFNAGQILDALDRLDIGDDTIVVWMSENGPEEAPSYTGTAGPWRGNYFTTLEGSLRTPFLLRWPGKIKPESVSNEIVHITDLLPTFAKVAGYKVPKDRKIDGVDQMAHLRGESSKSAREGFPAYNGDNMQSYKWRNFKIHYWDQQSMFASPTKLNFPQIHDLLKDPKELRGLYGGHDGGATGTEQLTWVLPAVTYEILKFKKTLQEEPPVPFPAPEPYMPPK